MERLAHRFEELEEADELANDRLPGMPLVGFLAGTVLSLAFWAGVAILVWGV